MLEKGETGGSLLELGFVADRVPGTSQAHPAFPFAFFFWLLVFALLSLSLALWDLWKNTLEVLSRRVYLSWG